MPAAYLLALPPGEYAAWASLPRYLADGNTGSLAPGEHATGVDFALIGGALELRGSVEDIAGGPIPRALVTARASTETDKDGKFSLWVRPGDLAIWASADGYGGASRTVSAPGPVRILLAPESTIQGRVVDAAGAPIANAKVTNTINDRTITTDDTGQFTLGPLPPGRYKLGAVAPGYHAETSSELLLGLGVAVTGVELRAVRAHQVALRLLDEHGAPCAKPRAALTPPQGDGWREGERIRFDGVTPGRYAVEGACGDDRGAPFPNIDVGDRDVEIELRMTATGATLSGRATLDGKPVHGAEVNLNREHGTEFTATSRVDGSFTIHAPPGHYTLRVQATQLKPLPDQPIELVAGANAHDIAFSPLDVSATIAGTFVDAQHRPIAFGQIGYANVVGPDKGSYWSIATDEHGAFEKRVEPGRYNIYALNALETVDVAHGQTARVELVAKLSAAITGKVTEDGRGVAGVTVITDEWSGPTATAVTAADGSFSIPATGYVNLVAYRDGAPSETLQARPGERVEIPLVHYGSVDGTVTRADGTPVDLVDVELVDGKVHTLRFSHGHFHFDRVVPGKLGLRATRNGDADGEQVEQTLAPGQQLTGIALRLPPSQDLAVRVLDASDRAPLANVKVDLAAPRGDHTVWVIHDDQRSGTDGLITIHDAPLGDARLEVAPPAGYARAKQAINVTAGMSPIDILVTRTH